MRRTGFKIAILGAGPAGLTAARYLASRGHEVHIYDKMPMPGGLMMFAIPEKRIPKRRIREQAQELERLGVVFNLGVKVQEGDREDVFDKLCKARVSLREIVQKYDAVLIATGAWRCRKLRIEGEDAQGVYTALSLIISLRLRELGLVQEELEIGNRVAVIGAGRTAVDVVEELVSRGRQVVLIYRRKLSESRAYRELSEILHKHADLIQVLECYQPVRICVSRGRVTGIEIAPVKIIQDKMVIDTDRTAVIDCDQVIEAIGEEPTPPMTEDSARALKIELKGGKIVVNERYQTANEKVFAAGDVVLGPSSIGQAVKTGLEAAKSIDMYLGQRLV